MKDDKLSKNLNPAETANALSRLFLWWMSDTIKLGYRKDLLQEDLHPPRSSDRSHLLGDRLEQAWRVEVHSSKMEFRKANLTRVLLKVFFFSQINWMIITAFQSLVLRMSVPFAIAGLLAFYNPRSTMSLQEAHGYAFLLLLLSFLVFIALNLCMLNLQAVGMQMRVACCSLLYRKILRMNRHSLGNTAAGQVINLMSNDVSRFDLMPAFVHYLWIVPIQIPLIAYFMWREVGLAALAGIGIVMLQSYATQVYISRRRAVLRAEIAMKTDCRVKLMSELVAGIQVIRMYAWEDPFAKMIKTARSLEMILIRKTSYFQTASLAVMVSTERLSLYATLITYLLAGGGMRGDVVYSMAQYCALLQLTCTVLFPMGLMFLGEALVSIKRIEKFLLHEELHLSIDSTPITNIEEKVLSKKIVLKNVSASWSSVPITGILQNISLEVDDGEFLAIVGPVGSGKSSLLQVLIGELHPTEGNLTFGNVSTSFAPQEPWLFVGSVRENILFGQEYDKERYKNVVQCCALVKDIEQFPRGDSTLVSERGISLSGGQRARINLARAIYRNADVYLLDDPLSAVDTQVGKHLMEKCIETFLAGKTRILVTHQLHHLKNADKIVIIRDGLIETQGQFKEVSNNSLFAELNTTRNTNRNKEDEPKKEIVNRESRARTESMQSYSSLNSKQNFKDEQDDSRESDELMEKGALSTSVIWRYIKAGGSQLYLTALLVTLIGTSIINGVTEWWLTFWINQEEYRSYNQLLTVNATDRHILTAANVENIKTLSVESLNGTMSTTPITIIGTYLKTVVVMQNVTDGNVHIGPILSMNTSIVIWSILFFLCFGLFIYRGFIFTGMCMNASSNLHDEIFGNVLHATMRFFDINPSGRILNRFSKDLGAIDEVLPQAIQEGVQMTLLVLGMATLIIIVNPYMIIMTIVVGVIVYFLTKVFMKTAQRLKRIEGITRSPVFSHVSSTLLGLSTIRLSGAQDMLQKQFDELQDVHTSAWFLTVAARSAFGLWVSFICWILFCIVVYALLIFKTDSYRSGDVGMSITQSLGLLITIQHSLRQVINMVTQMTSIERVLQYTDLPQEKPLESLPGSAPPKGWPSKGKIVIQNLYLRYYQSAEPVLRNINITIESGWKVGVIGRTGAGKSSLILALFRLTLVDGSIIIDDIDTSKIGLKDLRRKISIIPQEPVLFSASLRYNLDPFGQHSDADIWNALDDVELRNAVSSLNQMVTEGGGNFSAGQRQLLCLARAALNNNTIMVLDEATANVDPKTDALIQKTIRERFSSCTVITVAHRLQTVADSDRVLVMDNGVAAQFRHPHLLLEDAEGLFAKMVSQLGSAAEAGIREISKRAYQTHIKYADEEHRD